MIRCGTPPYLECSSKGDRRFSAFYARIKSRGNRTIEEIYQASKVFDPPIIINGVAHTTGLCARDAKGLKANNQQEVSELYSRLWDEYIRENPDLLHTLKEQSGLSDMFGQVGRNCQAIELWRIRNSF
jgi:hypothetical protein